MTEENTPRGNIYSANDPLDINELASLNDDISPEFIEQLQNKVSKNATEFTGRQIIPDKDDTELFEEVSADETKVAKPKFDESIDDNFIKKYKAKINKQQTVVETKEGQETAPNAEPQTISSSDNNTTSKDESSSKKDTVDKAQETPASVEAIDKNQASFEITEKDKPNANTDTEIKKDPQGNEEQPKKDLAPATQAANSDIGGLTSGNIIERPATQEQIDYNDSLDFLDGNVKYSAHVRDSSSLTSKFRTSSDDTFIIAYQNAQINTEEFLFFHTGNNST
jgi:hypothetical protein